MRTATLPFPITITQSRPTGSRGVSAGWEEAQVGRVLSHEYQIVRELGRGGMGVVFLARDVALHRLVALKVLRYEFVRSEEHRERFRREARLTARLSHGNIVPVHTFGEHGDLVYIVMKYVHGESLADRMRRDGRLSAGEARDILVSLARALDSAHREGVVHRDLKAENILIEKGTGRAMLTDFGVALLRSLDPVPAEVTRAFGTPHYMSPEQAAGESDLDGRSDIYSLGILAFYMLSGRLPFDAPSFEALAAQHIASAAPALGSVTRGIPDAMVGIVERCLEKNRDGRWRTGAHLADALAAVKVRRERRRTPVRSAVTTRTVFRTRLAAELAMVAPMLRAFFMRAGT